MSTLLDHYHSAKGRICFLLSLIDGQAGQSNTLYLQLVMPPLFRRVLCLSSGNGYFREWIPRFGVRYDVRYYFGSWPTVHIGIVCVIVSDDGYEKRHDNRIPPSTQWQD